ncbi:MAG: PulJ/GspJ family protein, partial [Candidatus Saccharimonadales bacterium]
MKQGGERSSGFTIVEVMIFLAVSSLMFLAAVVFISGKQATVEFHQSMADINSQINKVVNQVANGEYNSLGSYTCVAPTAGGSPKITNVATTAQGANGPTGNSDGCVFLGKVLQFNADGVNTKYRTYTLASRQFTNGLNPVMSFTAATPIAVDSTASAPSPSQANLSQTTALGNGTVATASYFCTPVCSSIGAFGFFGSFAGQSGSNPGDLESGAQSVTAAIIPNAPNPKAIYGA